MGGLSQAGKSNCQVRSRQRNPKQTDDVRSGPFQNRVWRGSSAVWNLVLCIILAPDLNRELNIPRKTSPQLFYGKSSQDIHCQKIGLQDLWPHQASQLQGQLRPSAFPLPSLILGDLDQLCPIEKECMPHIILNSLVNILKVKWNSEINFNSMFCLAHCIQTIIIWTCNHQKKLFMRQFPFFPLQSGAYTMDGPSQFGPATFRVLHHLMWLPAFHLNSIDWMISFKVLHTQQGCPRLGPGTKPARLYSPIVFASVPCLWVGNGPEKARALCWRTWLGSHCQLPFTQQARPGFSPGICCLSCLSESWWNS